MLRKLKAFSTQRRHFLSDRVFSSGTPVMRFCAFCVSRQSLYIMSDDSEHCFACFQANRSCDLAPFYTEIARLDKAEDKLIAEFSAAHRAV